MEFLALNELLCFFVAHPKKSQRATLKVFPVDDLFDDFLFDGCLDDDLMPPTFFPNNKHYAARLFAIDPNCDNSCGCR